MIDIFFLQVLISVTLTHCNRTSALKLAIWVNCVSENVFAPLPREVRGIVSAMEHTPGAGRDYRYRGTTLLPNMSFVNDHIIYTLKPSRLQFGENSHLSSDGSSEHDDKDISREGKNENNIFELCNPSHLCPVPPICGLMMTQRWKFILLSQAWQIFHLWMEKKHFITKCAHTHTRIHTHMRS